ncbi:unnamed protein product [Didymodactylos carnosus]|uniref:Uncharacterized protein n=1 Tax=Didymodactylos carnosus TaxID=1234261 RepID=A0A814IJ54_9BILA|nr:unnamed protein product [Didymodactylos carnosus]CAF3796076.1 unnamed protein product [Didymodactylos carnosus]
MIYHLSIHHPKEHALFRQQQPNRQRTNGAVLPLDHARSKELSHLLCEFVIRDLEPLSFTESSETLKKLMRQLEPSYLIPTRNYFRDNIIKNQYEKVKLELQEQMKEAGFIQSRQTCGHQTIKSTTLRLQHISLIITTYYKIKL